MAEKKKNDHDDLNRYPALPEDFSYPEEISDEEVSYPEEIPEELLELEQVELELKEEERKKKEAEEKRKAEEERKKRETEELRKKQEEDRKKRAAEAARKAEEDRKKKAAEAARKAEEDRKKREAEELRKKQEEDRKKRAAEAARKAEEERKKREAEELRRKQEEDRKKRAAEAARRAEEERKRREAEELRKKQEEERKRQAVLEKARREAEQTRIRKEKENAQRRRRAQIAIVLLLASALVCAGAVSTLALPQWAMVLFIFACAAIAAYVRLEYTDDVFWDSELEPEWGIFIDLAMMIICFLAAVAILIWDSPSVGVQRLLNGALAVSALWIMAEPMVLLLRDLWVQMERRKVTRNVSVYDAVRGIDPGYKEGPLYKLSESEKSRRKGAIVAAAILAVALYVWIGWTLVVRTILPSAYPAVQAGDQITFGHYEQDGDPQSTEPIVWDVLSVRGNLALVVSDVCLDVYPYGILDSDGQYLSAWSTSALRGSLNQLFYKEAFTDEEREMIRSAEITTDEILFEEGGVTRTKTGVSETTIDYVFVLSQDEVTDFTDVTFSAAAAAKYETVRSFENGTMAWLRNPLSTGRNMGAGWYEKDGGLHTSYYVLSATGMLPVKPAMYIDLDAYRKLPASE